MSHVIRWNVSWLLACGILVLCVPGVGFTMAADVAGSTVTVSADAFDNVGVVGVQFFLDGVPLGSEDTAAPYSISWNTTLVSDGAHTLTAVARDGAGNEGASLPVVVNVSNSSGEDPGTDDVPPVVQVTGPPNGAVLSSIATITGSASDNVGVVGVQFFLDGAALGPEDTLAPYSMTWNTATVPNGSHLILARARDASGNLATSSAVAIQVNNPTIADGTPPVVTTTGPANGSTVFNSVSVTAAASDDFGVVGVRFLLDGQPFGVEDATPPYAVAWDTRSVSNGFHVIAARARDAAGNQTVSAGVGVIVANAEEDPGDSNAQPVTSGAGTVELFIEPLVPGFQRIRAQSDTGSMLQLYIGGELVATVSGHTLQYDWDIRGLLGSHEVRVVSMNGSDVVASSTMFHSVGSTQVPSVTLDVVELPLIGATYVQGVAEVGGGVRLELYIDGDLHVTKLGKEIKYAWDPGPGVHEILFVAFDALGIVASVSVVYLP